MPKCSSGFDGQVIARWLTHPPLLTNPQSTLIRHTESWVTDVSVHIFWTHWLKLNGPCKFTMFNDFIGSPGKWFKSFNNVSSQFSCNSSSRGARNKVKALKQHYCISITKRLKRSTPNRDTGKVRVISAWKFLNLTKHIWLISARLEHKAAERSIASQYTMNLFRVLHSFRHTLLVQWLWPFVSSHPHKVSSLLF